MAYLLQIACVTVLAEALLRLIPVRSAGFRYAYWRLVLAGALLMPWLLRTTSTPDEPVDDAAAAVSTLPFDDLSAIPAAWSETGAAWMDASWMTLVPWIVLAGAAVRLSWVGAGIMRLRALRRAGEPVADAEYDEMQQRLGTHADLRSVAGLAQPVTFGLRRPIVLLPESLRSSADSIRRAVVTHELVHVRRRDWLWVMAEEALRAALWFHPAIWWLISRIRRTREEFTDHIAVLASGSRRQYMQALLAFADTVPLEPAPAFARRAHLFHRITLLSTEPAMSARRIVFSGALVLMLLATGGWYASEAFPVVVERAPVAAGQVPTGAGGSGEQELKPITPENPIPRRVFATPIAYPLELNGTGFESAVDMHVVLNAAGAVSNVRRGAIAVNSPRPGVGMTEQQAMEIFAATAADAIARWQYDPPANAPIGFYVSVTFKPGVAATASQSEAGRGVRAGPEGARLLEPGELPALELFQIARGGGVSASSFGRGRAAGGRVFTRLEETLTVPARGVQDSTRPAIRVGGNVPPPLQTRKVNPVYPPLAAAARVSGVVILEVEIDEQGNVRNPRVLRSIPLLDQAALDAVNQWQYEPILLNGAPVPAILTVTVQFTPEP